MGNPEWRYIEEYNVTASRGLASDEVMVLEQEDPHSRFPVSLKLYTYANYAALCGRFQNLSAEIDVEACRLKGFGISRRLTGGGAIVMGRDQLGICLSTSSSRFRWNHIRELYQLFSAPIVQALSGLGIEAGLRAKNDLEVNGRKIAGLGIHITPGGGIQFHASLLLDLDIPQMLGILKIPIQKYADRRMIAAVEQRMTTVRKESGRRAGMEDLKQRLRESFSSSFGVCLTPSPFSAKENDHIMRLENERYLSEGWLYQNTPQDDMAGMSLIKTSAGLIRTYIGTKGETIKSVLVTGDFLEMPEAFTLLESQLKWSTLNIAAIRERVERSLLDHPAAGLSADELTEAIWLAAQRALPSHRFTYKGSCYYPGVPTASDVVYD